jgi:hypothetical protein
MTTIIRGLRNGVLISQRTLNAEEACVARLQALELLGDHAGATDEATREMARRRQSCSPCGHSDPNLGEG